MLRDDLTKDYKGQQHGDAGPPVGVRIRPTYAAEQAKDRKRTGTVRIGGGSAARRGYVTEALERLASRATALHLRYYQTRAIEKFAEHLKDRDNDPRGIVVIPTAGGKTRIFMTMVDALRSCAADGRRVMPNAILLVPTRTLIRQTYLAFRKEYPEVEIGYQASTEFVDDEGEVVPRSVRPATLMTYTAFANAVARGDIRRGDVDIIVMDEAHRGLSDLRKATLKPFLDGTVIGAFTASPAFDEFKTVHAFLGARNEVFQTPAQELREKGFIAPVINYVMAIKLDGDGPSDRDEYRQVKRKALVDGVIDFIESHTDAELELALSNKIAIFYGADRSHARMFAAEYNARLGHRRKKMAVLSGDDPPEVILETIRLIRSGKLTGIANAQLLVEGFDLPQIGLVVNSQTASIVKSLQQSGRAQRKNPDLPDGHVDQTAFVIDAYYRINGKIEGRPRFYFEAAGEPALGRTVETGPKGFSAVDISGYPAMPGTDEEEDDERDNDTDFDGFTAGTGGEAVRPKKPPVQVSPVTPTAKKGTGKRRVPFVVSTEIEATVRLIGLRDRENLRTPEWLTFDLLAGRLQTDLRRNAKAMKLWPEIVKATKSGDRPVVRGRRVRAEQRVGNSRTPVCLHESEVEWFAAEIGSARPVAVSGDVVTFSGLAKEQGIRLAPDSPLGRLRKKLEAAYAKGQKLRVGGRDIALVPVRTYLKSHLQLRREDLGAVCSHLGVRMRDYGKLSKIPEADGDLLASATLAEAMGSRGYMYKKPFRTLMARAANSHAKGLPFEVGGRSFTAETRRLNGHETALCIPADAMPYWAAEIGAQGSLPVKAAPWLNRVDVAKAIRVTPTSEALAAVLDDVWAQHDAIVGSDPSGRPAKTKLGTHVVEVALRWTKRRVHCIHGSAMTAVKAAVARRAADIATARPPKVRTSKFRPYAEARAYARELGLKNFQAWQAFCRSGKRPADIPANPGSVYAADGFAGYADWLGTRGARKPKEWRSFAKARAFARSLGLPSTAAWAAWAKTSARPADVPTNPHVVYASRWKGMQDWLGTDGTRKTTAWRPFLKARAFARSLGIRTQAEWAGWAKTSARPADIPSNPQTVYAEWKGVPDWLGTAKGRR